MAAADRIERVLRIQAIKPIAEVPRYVEKDPFEEAVLQKERYLTAKKAGHTVPGKSSQMRKVPTHQEVSILYNNHAQTVVYDENEHFDAKG